MYTSWGGNKGPTRSNNAIKTSKALPATSTFRPCGTPRPTHLYSEGAREGSTVSILPPFPSLLLLLLEPPPFRLRLREPPIVWVIIKGYY